jgi:hypothetical protein
MSDAADFAAGPDKFQPGDLCRSVLIMGNVVWQSPMEVRDGIFLGFLKKDEPAIVIWADTMGCWYVLTRFGPGYMQQSNLERVP